MQYQRAALVIASPALTQREVEFTKSAWLAGLRPDQRTAQQMREVSVEFPLLSRDVVVVRCGGSVVTAAIATALVEPTPQRPKHGLLHFSVRRLHTERDSPAADGSTQKNLVAFLERLVRTGGVIDTAGLCVLPGQKVWSLTVDVTIMNDEGNCNDAAVWAVIALLMHHRRPELTVRGSSVIVHPPHEREPVPLSVQHTPLPFTFAITMAPTEREKALNHQRALSATGSSSGPQPSSGVGNSIDTASAFAIDGTSPQPLGVVVDPTTAESLAAASSIVVAINAEGQVCTVVKAEGCSIHLKDLNACIEAAGTLAPRVLDLIKVAMEAHDERRKTAMKGQFAWAQKRSGVGKVEQTCVKKIKTET
ncbi:ribosomal RNA processing protein 45 [Trypanosoma brucei gambiense DAL972]|uniref:Ribosomal RNA processing protein 45 n=2 Tax=Trypanosoma brucei TaxID=5691 RepID=C9ZQ76_TRYB9|nr:ribosomal RNA processing protein 45 [Trypanosoma brucei gambiense DAL972]RHW71806.1 ribosomal RNA processing protein 45 [Trypanosoma brucei equiperdum]CBH11556.1 ribosomal RNA processing protein 45 [Trypanosoma brucei gambiense DAL972]|eukprot:XP_011773841.1 ribosomal RNA processing protein 45 [Trypanosoma brucei gambiense DAL972]